MFYAVEILSHKKPLGVPWICGVYDARSKLPVGACAILARARHGAIYAACAAAMNKMQAFKIARRTRRARDGRRRARPPRRNCGPSTTAARPTTTTTTP